MEPAYEEDPNDPNAPVRLDHHGEIYEGMMVVYTNSPPLPGPHIVSQIWDLHIQVSAILDEGVWEVNIENLKAAKSPFNPRGCRRTDSDS